MNLWALTWQWRTLPFQPTQLWNANAFYPAANSILGSDHLFSLVLLGLPFFWVTGNPFLAYHAVLFCSFAIGGLGFFMLGRLVFRDTWAAVLSGTYFVVAIPRTVQAVGHIQIAHFQWLPWSLFFLIRYRQTGRQRHAAGFAAAAVLQILSSWYLAVFEVLVLGIVIPFSFTGVRNRRMVLTLMAALALIAAAVIPFALPYAGSASAEYSNVAAASARVTDYFTPPAGTLWSRILGIQGGWGERTVFPGYLVIALCLTAAIQIACSSPVRSPDPVGHRAFIGVLIAGAAAWMLSLGPFAGASQRLPLPFYYLSALSETMSQIRAPARFSQVVIATLALASGWSLFQIRTGLAGKKLKNGLASAVVCAVLIEQFPFTRFTPAVTPRPDVYQWLSHEPENTVIAEIPEYYGTELWSFSAEYMLFSIFHEKKVVNGYTRNIPEDYPEHARWLADFPDHEALVGLGRLGVDYIVIHRRKFFQEKFLEQFTGLQSGREQIDAANDMINEFNRYYSDCYCPAGEAAVQRVLTSPHLELIRRFDDDYVFRIREEILLPNENG